MRRGGKKAAPRIGRYINGNGLVPDLVLCSTAERAHQTLELVSAEWDRRSDGPAVKVEMRASLYLATPPDLLAAINTIAPEVESAMIIGHNPGLAMLARLLVTKGDPRGIKTMEAKFPTAALAVITFDVDDWQAVSRGMGKLQSFVRPKDLT